MNTNRPILASLVLLIVTTTVLGCSLFQGVRGSGVAKSENRQVQPFKKITLEGFADVNVNVDPRQPQTLSVTTDDNLLLSVDTTVRDGTLIISNKENISTTMGVKISITVAQLDGTEIEGSGDLTAHGVAGKSFYATVSGSGDVKVDGSADSLQATISGSGDIDATKLATSDASVSITGSGSALVNAQKTVHAQITGSGDVRYAGSPNVSKQITGSGSVTSTGK